VIGGRAHGFGRLLQRRFSSHNAQIIGRTAHDHFSDISRRAPGLDIFPHPSFIISPANIISDYRVIRGISVFAAHNFQPAAPGRSVPASLF
jgi:hypothetical protein